MTGLFARVRLRIKLASDRRELLRRRAQKLEIQRQTQAHYREVTASTVEVSEANGPQRRA
jgi:hypothetical protein